MEAFLMPGNYNNRYNNGRNNYNNRPNYNNRNNYNNKYRDNYRPDNNDNVMVSLRQFKQDDILIEDMNGKKYTICGNFATEFIMDMLRVHDRLDELKKNSGNVAYTVEMFEILKNWCLKFINMNTSGIEYTMTDVNIGFNDYKALEYLFNFIVKTINKQDLKLATANA